MTKRTIWATVAGVALAAAVAGTAGVGIAWQRATSDLTHAPALALEQPGDPLEPASNDAPLDPAARAELAKKLDALAADKSLGTLHGQVTDAATGEVVWDHKASEALTPASSTKVLTASAALLTLPADDRLTTTVVPGAESGTVVIKAAGDVWLDDDRLDDLAAQLRTNHPEPITNVQIDTSVWTGPTQARAWDPTNVDGGFVAPMEPAMINGGRIGETTGDVPRSHTPALDVAHALADRVEADDFSLATAPSDSGSGTDEAADQTGVEPLASTESPELYTRLESMLEHSDNVMAEAVAREVAIKRGAEPSFAGATTATLDALGEAGIDATGVEIYDNSGLSEDNRIPPAVLNAVLHDAATGPDLRSLLADLPTAGATGTLAQRYEDMSGRGWVRAKTGTLTGVNALVGTVTSTSDRVYTFALLSNDSPDILSARQTLDKMASALRDSEA